MKYFTRQEADALIPDLETLFKKIIALEAKAQVKLESLQALEAKGDQPAQFALEKGQIDFLAKEINVLLQSILDLGAMPKGIDPALVDFPHRLGGKEVYLCWRLGEKKITHYHGLEGGFGAREPLP